MAQRLGKTPHEPKPGERDTGQDSRQIGDGNRCASVAERIDKPDKTCARQSEREQ
jgi:hypothetical protein